MRRHLCNATWALLLSKASLLLVAVFLPPASSKRGRGASRLLGERTQTNHRALAHMWQYPVATLERRADSIGFGETDLVLIFAPTGVAYNKNQGNGFENQASNVADAESEDEDLGCLDVGEGPCKEYTQVEEKATNRNA